MTDLPTEEQLRKINAAAARIRILWWGDIVRPDDHNAIVDFLNAIDEAFDVPGLDEYLAKLKYVKKGDIISSEQFNLTVDALKVAVPYVLDIYDDIYGQLEIFAEYSDDALKALDDVKYASPGKIVHSKNWNKRNEAVLKFAYIVLQEFMKVELYAYILLDYDLSELIITALGKVAADFDTTTEIVESVLRDIAVSFTLTTDAVSVSTRITESVLAFLDTLDLLAYIKAVHDETISSLDASPVIRSTFDFPGLLSAMLNVVLSYDFPESITKLGIVSTEYDFPELLSLDLTFDYAASLWIDLVESTVNVVSAHDETTKFAEAGVLVDISELLTFIESITLIQPDIAADRDTTTESVTGYCAITTGSDAALAVGAEGFIEAVIETFAEIAERAAAIAAAGEISELLADLAAAVSLSFTVTYAEIAELYATPKLDLHATTELLDFTPITQLDIETFYDSFDLQPRISESVETAYDSFDLQPTIKPTIERTTEAFDIPQSFGTAIDGMTDAHDIPQTLDTDIDGSTKSSDLEISVARTSLEFKLIYWMDIDWAYRRPITIDNSAGDLTDYQIAIVLTPENFDYSKANPDGSDIRITDNDGITKLPYWIEVWNPNGTSIVWTKIPSLPAGTYTIYLYYGNPDAESEENPAEVFDVFEGFETDPIGVDMSIHVGGGMTNVKVIKS